MRGFGDRKFCVAAADHQGAHLVADGQAIDPLAQHGNTTRNFEPRNFGRSRRWRIEAGTLHHVRAIHAGRDHLDQHLARPRLRKRRGLDRDYLRAARTGEMNPAHSLGQGGAGHRRVLNACVSRAASGLGGPFTCGNGAAWQAPLPGGAYRAAAFTAAGSTICPCARLFGQIATCLPSCHCAISPVTKPGPYLIEWVNGSSLP